MKRSPMKRSRRRLPKSRQTEAGELERQCEEAWREYIIQRDGKCPISGETDDLDAAHIIPRSASLNTKFDVDNGIALSRKWHIYFTDRPGEWLAWCVVRFSARKMAELAAKARIKVYSAGPVWYQEKLYQLISGTP